jgi:hypothetical protein
MAFLGATNLVALDDFDDYISQLAQRIRSESE